MGIVEFYRSLTPAIQSTIWVTLFLILVIVLLRIKMRNYSADKPAKGNEVFRYHRQQGCGRCPAVHGGQRQGRPCHAVL